MADLLHLVKKLNDFQRLDMSFGSNDRAKAIKIIKRFCNNNNINYYYDWKSNKFVINNKYLLFKNSLDWFEIKKAQ